MKQGESREGREEVIPLDEGVVGLGDAEEGESGDAARHLCCWFSYYIMLVVIFKINCIIIINNKQVILYT